MAAGKCVDETVGTRRLIRGCAIGKRQASGTMGPAYFVIAILGCGDDAVGCKTVATPAAHYASEQSCLAARDEVLMANSDLDFPSLMATCLPASRKASAAEPDDRPSHSVAA